MNVRTIRHRVADILREIDEIERALDEHGLLHESWIVRRAVERGLEIVSEASRSLPEHIKARASGIDWSGMAGFGNIARHGYDVVDWGLVKATIRTDLPPLRRFLASLTEEDLDAQAAKRR